MKKASPPSSPDINIDPEILVRNDVDTFGQLPRSGWSCLILDFADIAAPMFGKKGMELYYRMAQGMEAYSTRYEGDDEANIRQIFSDHYVDPSLNRERVMRSRMRAFL